MSHTPTRRRTRSTAAADGGEQPPLWAWCAVPYAISSSPKGAGKRFIGRVVHRSPSGFTVAWADEDYTPTTYDLKPRGFEVLDAPPEPGQLSLPYLTLAETLAKSRNSSNPEAAGKKRKLEAHAAARRNVWMMKRAFKIWLRFILRMRLSSWTSMIINIEHATDKLEAALTQMSTVLQGEVTLASSVHQSQFEFLTQCSETFRQAQQQDPCDVARTKRVLLTLNPLLSVVGRMLRPFFLTNARSSNLYSALADCHLSGEVEREAMCRVAWETFCLQPVISFCTSVSGAPSAREFCLCKTG